MFRELSLVLVPHGSGVVRRRAAGGGGQGGMRRRRRVQLRRRCVRGRCMFNRWEEFREAQGAVIGKTVTF